MKFEQTPSQEDLEKSRKVYEKNADKVAKENNSITENLLGKGFTSEDVARYEAGEEEKRRNELAEIRQKIAGQGIEDPTLAEEEQQKEKRLSREQNSSLVIEHVFPSTISAVKDQIKELFGKTIDEMPSSKLMKGLIDGKKVKIEASPKETWREEVKEAPYVVRPETHPGQFIFNGTIDGKKITSEEAQQIFKEYRNNAAEKSL